MVKIIARKTIKSILTSVKKLISYKEHLPVKMTSSESFVEEVVCLVSDLQENQLKTFKLCEGEVLLVKQNYVVRALGTKCTHYGAPLVNGALGNGRIRCPWHGACFNLSTGDIEDFPGFDSLPCYQVIIEGQNVKVRAKKSDLAANKRVKKMIEKYESTNDSIVVVGGGPAAAICVETLRQENFGGEITMICKENFLPYDRVKCSKQLDFDITAAQFRNDSFYQNHGINILKGVEAVAIDTANKNVVLSNNTNIPYTKLFLATGNSPAKPSLPGIDLENVFVVRNYNHAKTINSLLSKDKNLLVVGSGFIGMEITDYCIDKVKKITILMRGSSPLSHVLGKEIGDAILKIFQKKNVEFLSDVNITQINGNGKVENVELSNGTTLPIDIVVMGIGVTPNTSFLKNSGINLESDGTVATNMYLETNVPNVYAGGDIALAPVWCSDNAKAAIGHFGLAHYHGRIAGLNMAGKITELKSVPYFWTKLAGFSIRYCGYGQFDDVIYTGNVDDMKFLFIYLKNDNVVAMSSCGMDPYVSKFAELTAQGKKLKRGDVCRCSKDIFEWAK